jgi:hypothetical protein
MALNPGTPVKRGYRKYLKGLLFMSAAFLAGAALRPAAAQGPSVCMVLEDRLGNKATEIWITNFGTLHAIQCHGPRILSFETFTVCPDPKSPPLGTPSEGVCIGPFIQTLVPTDHGTDVETRFLEQTGTVNKPGFEGVPIFTMSEQDPRPRNGTLVNVVVRNDPVEPGGLGVETFIQWKIGTCKVWVTRKFFNTGPDPLILASYREAVFVKNALAFSGVPTSSTSASADTAEGQLTLTTRGTGNVIFGRAGSQLQSNFDIDFGDEIDCCKFADGFTRDFVDVSDCGDDLTCNRFLEALLCFGQTTLAPKGQTGSELFVTNHFDVD